MVNRNTVRGNEATMNKGIEDGERGDGRQRMRNFVT